MLTRQLIEAELSYAYLHAIAAKASYSADIPHIDADSVDAIISATGKVAADSIRNSPRIEIQLKASKNLIVNADGNFAFSLSMKNYNELRADTLLPRLLVLFALPDDENEWLVHHPDQLVMKKCAYFLNLKGLPASQNGGNQTVYVPATNMLTPDVLKSLMIKASKMEDL